mmetsp:Transcript_5072/g.10493  ORF Transcript_5072/g.10493 Transcript_5072/m.10493 type:complete len:85 (+) Transcript_5072:77-331(+)
MGPLNHKLSCQLFPTFALCGATLSSPMGWKSNLNDTIVGICAPIIVAQFGKGSHYECRFLLSGFHRCIQCQIKKSEQLTEFHVE